jgi:tetratricopeptide (TPR) repeat protein
MSANFAEPHRDNSSHAGNREESDLPYQGNWLPAILLVLVLGIGWLVLLLPSEVARWHVAVADVALYQGDLEQFESSREAAIEWNPEIVSYIPYNMLLQKKYEIEGKPTKILELFRDLLRSPETINFALQVAYKQDRRGDFKTAFLLIREIESLLESAGDRLPADLLNQFAYARASADDDLEKALEQINEALRRIEPNSETPSPQQKSKLVAYRDTRAWILYRLGRYDDALVDANFAVETDTALLGELLEKSDPIEALPEIDRSGFDELSENERIISVHKQLEKEFETLLLSPRFASGVLRYHRSQILRELGLEEQAEEDMKWLENNNLTEPEILH